jgi:hypothetical protein
MTSALTGQIMEIPRNACAQQMVANTNNALDPEMFGRTIAQQTGSMNIVAGTNAEATGATASRTIASVRILAVGTGFAFVATQS